MVLGPVNGYAEGNFRLKEDSPAMPLGFRPFPSTRSARIKMTTTDIPCRTAEHGIAAYFSASGAGPAGRYASTPNCIGGVPLSWAPMSGAEPV